MTALDGLRPLIGIEAGVPGIVGAARDLVPAMEASRSLPADHLPCSTSGIRREPFPIANSPAYLRTFMRNVAGLLARAGLRGTPR